MLYLIVGYTEVASEAMLIVMALRVLLKGSED